MQQRHIGQQGLQVSALGLGCMGMSEFYGASDDQQSLDLMQAALELGVNWFDTADAYGPHHNEALIGQFLKGKQRALRIATKFGIVRRPGEYQRQLDNRPDYIRQACEASLQRLGVECIDLYYVHRVNPLHPIEDTMETLAELVKQGKIAHIGLCEVSSDTLRRAHAVHPVTALQTEYSLWCRDIEQDILPTCRELGIGLVPYAPLGRGFLTGTMNTATDFADDDFRGSLPRFQAEVRQHNLQLTQGIAAMAAEKQCTAAQLCLAWLLAQGDDIAPIPGTRRLSYLQQNVAAAEIQLTTAECQRLTALSDGFIVQGERYTSEGMKGVNA